uniref:Uncharacterized protein n=4 Tax=Nymphaea colorata TaxID=210225 RepID=A0A5K1A266_9MAGN
MKDISFGEVNGKSNKADQDPKSQ